jgi:L-iditol 2-dehydrogenase
MLFNSGEAGMKAIRLHGPGDARWEEVDCPPLDPDRVLVRVKAASICATDVELYDGVMVYLTSGLARYPLIPGHEWSGEVVEAGAHATAFHPGDRVVGECSIGCRQCVLCRRGAYHLCRDRCETGLLGQQGAFAEYISFPRFFLHHCRDLGFEDAACIEPTGVAVHAVRRTRVTPADNVVVMGAGPIGLFAVQVARAYGARTVIAVDRRPARLRAARELGADAAIDATGDDLIHAVGDLTGGLMASVVIEATGNRQVWDSLASMLAPGARVGMLGLCGGSRCAVDFDPLVVKDISVFGCLGGPGLWEEAISLHQRGLVRSRGIVTHRLPLSEFSGGVEIARSQANGAIKVVLQP